MKMDVVGRVKNVQLPISKPLLPLFEAIMNAIQAIEDAKEEHGKIDVEVIRDNSPTLLAEDRGIADITGFIIKDNGIGFDEKNYEAFLTSDTTYKASRGGKGIGRFLWLTAFEKVEIDSVFGETQKKRRRFKFCLSEKAIEDDTCIDESNSSRGTTVRLIGYKQKYSHNCRKRLDSLATLIVEQFLDVFIGPGCPKITVHDNLTGESVDLDKFYEKEIVANIQKKDRLIKDKNFNFIFVRLYSTHISDHKVNLCANDRVVVSERLSGIPNLMKRFTDDAKKEFVCAVYVNSSVLDAAVNQERTDFSLLKSEEGLFDQEIFLTDIWQAIRESCKDYLKPYTGPIAKLKQERIEKFVANEGVMYRPILKHLEDKINQIEPDADNDEIDKRLYEGYYELQVKLREEGQSLLQEASNVTDQNFEEYKKKFDEYFERITEANSADLARYVCHRKAILEFLKKQLGFQKEGKYSQENQIHSIIFPRGRTSDDINFSDHNLWLIDERLAFHTFLSSDQPINKAKHLQNESKKEPDILVFDKAVAFSEAPAPFSSITIIEFKKPQRKEYSENENPFVQVAKYIEEIKAGKAVTRDGRPLPISANLPFYCYIICDITPGLKQWAQHFELQETPDNLGFFGYKRHYNAYCEVVSYDKLVLDVEKRNKAFFTKLGL
ncbi:MAG: ATP-binding protein [bacterium]|nr:ATP-binding protein [bacterium]